MRTIPTIAIVGRPNVGKSAIFNRLVKRRIAIVHDEPGITRDRITAPCMLTDYACDVIDTGGIGATLSDGFAEQVAAEADIAMEMADIILFVLDSRDNLTPIDENIANHLRRSEVPVILALNKADHDKQDLNIGEFASLGFDEYVFLSAAHGRGLNNLTALLDQKLKAMDAITQEDRAQATETELTEDEDATPAAPGTIKVAIVGRPNAGKSSLINAILEDKRTIVSDIAGTTRDAIDVPYTYKDQPYMLIDTAGMRQRSRRDTSVEVFSAMRSEKAIRRSDICLLVVDIAGGITQQDRRIAGIIAESRKPCIIVANKYDLFHPDAAPKARLAEAKTQVQTELFFVNYAPFITTSALKGDGIQHIFKQIDLIKEEASKIPSTGQLNRLIQFAMQKNPPGPVGSAKKRLKIYYSTTATDPKYSTIPVPKFVLFVNDKEYLQDNYAQYLRSQIRAQYPAPGVPIIFSARSRLRTDRD